MHKDDAVVLGPLHDDVVVIGPLHDDDDDAVGFGHSYDDDAVLLGPRDFAARRHSR